MFLFTHVFFFISSFLEGCKEYPFYQFFLNYIFWTVLLKLTRDIPGLLNLGVKLSEEEEEGMVDRGWDSCAANIPPALGGLSPFPLVGEFFFSSAFISSNASSASRSMS